MFVLKIIVDGGYMPTNQKVLHTFFLERKEATYFLLSQYNESHNCVIPIDHNMHQNCTFTLIYEKIFSSMRASLHLSLLSFIE
jgi:hypothetical protein